MARFREAERPALFRPVDFLPLDFRALDFRPPDREDFRAELPPPRFADLLDFLADRPALFLAPFRADFLLLRLAEPRADFFREPPRAPPGEVPREPLVPLLLPVGAGSSKSKDGDEVGVGEGVLSEGRGSIHPEPDQPISI